MSCFVVVLDERRASGKSAAVCSEALQQLLQWMFLNILKQLSLVWLITRGLTWAPEWDISWQMASGIQWFSSALNNMVSTLPQWGGSRLGLAKKLKELSVQIHLPLIWNTIWPAFHGLFLIRIQWALFIVLYSHSPLLGSLFFFLSFWLFEHNR